jgi:hypothetical protein
MDYLFQDGGKPKKPKTTKPKTKSKTTKKGGNFLGTVGDLVAPTGWGPFATAAALVGLDRVDAALRRGKSTKSSAKKGGMRGGDPNNHHNKNWKAPPIMSMNNFTNAPIDFERFKKNLNKLRKDLVEAEAINFRDESNRIDKEINNLTEKYPQFMNSYHSYRKKKAESNKKAAEAKKAEYNESERKYIASKKAQEKRNKDFLQGSSVPPQSYRAVPNYNGWSSTR